MKDHAKKPPRQTRAKTEEKLDEAIEELFPASDPLASNPSFIGGPERSPPSRAARKPRSQAARAGLMAEPVPAISTRRCGHAERSHK